MSITEDGISSENMEYGLTVIRFVNGSGEWVGLTYKPVFHKLCPANPKGSSTCSLGFHRYVFQ
jgi:hypothetical protein